MAAPRDAVELNAEDQWCPYCDYRVHPGDTCEIAAKKADLVDEMLRIFVR